MKINIVNLHYQLSKAVVKSRPTVLWCYKNELEISSHKEKRKKQLKKYVQKGLLDPEKVEPFELFSKTVSYFLYRDSERILGNTYGICLLKDFEALTPNLLARTIETVEGGGLIVLLLRTLPSPKSLYTLVMVHSMITSLDAILDKTLRSTVALLAARGRVKSAAFGLSIAGAVAAGYSNIYVTAPSPENLKTLFDFVYKGFSVLEYKEHPDYDIVKSNAPEFKKTTLRINIYKQNSQTIQHLFHYLFSSLLGPYLVFLASTLNGNYEGTGRSLSLKLLQQLEEQSQKSKVADNAISGISDPLLLQMMVLYVASHYKNSPNDLQLMADAPAHHLFVLLGPVDESENHIPDILCVIQSAKRALREGRQPFGDQIPWKFSQKFADDVFPSLSGALIVRIATHPRAMRMGYGSAAVELLTKYFEGQLTQLSEVETEDALETPQVNVTEAAEEFALVKENVTPRTALPPLLVPLCERRSERLHYLGASFGITLDLLSFWRKHKFAPFFIGNAPNSVTGEYTCMVLKVLKNDDVEAVGSDEWGFYGPYYREYKRRLVELFGSTYRKMNYKLAMKEKFILTRNQKLSRQQICKYLNNLTSKEIESTVSRLKMIKMKAHSISVDEDLNDAAKKDEMKAKPEGLLDPELFHKFAIVDREADFECALQNGGGKIVPGSVISVKSNQFRFEKHSKMETEKSGRKRNKNHSGSKSSKRKS
ncbi:unnamed protein product [Withania somnifera]